MRFSCRFKFDTSPTITNLDLRHRGLLAEVLMKHRDSAHQFPDFG
jgi:hypothetical protein